MAIKTLVEQGTGSVKWNTAATWAEVAAVPGVGDDVRLTGKAKLEIATASAKCRTLFAKEFEGTLSGTTGSLQVGEANIPTEGEIVGKMIWIGPNVTTSLGESFSIKLVSTNSGTQGVTTNSKTLCPLTIAGTGQVIKFEDNIVLHNADLFEFARGTLKTEGHSVTCGKFQYTGLNGTSATLEAGSSTFTLAGKGKVFSLSGAGTLTATLPSKIELTDTSSELKEFEAWKGEHAEFSVPELVVKGDNTQLIAATTYTTLKLENAGGTTGTLVVASGTITVGTLTTNSKSGLLVRIASKTAGTKMAIALTKATSIDYAKIKDVEAKTNVLYAGTHSEDEGNNTNVKFEEPPSASSMGMLI